MIVFELMCSNGHRFETWFKNGAAYDAQSATGDITCPCCGDTQIAKAPMAPHVARSVAKTGDRDGRDNPKQAVVESVSRVVGELKRHIRETCDYVADDFPEEARRIHYGESEERGIYGEASEKEAKDLKDEGINVQRIPWFSQHDN